MAPCTRYLSADYTPLHPVQGLLSSFLDIHLGTLHWNSPSFIPPPKLAKSARSRRLGIAAVPSRARGRRATPDVHSAHPARSRASPDGWGARRGPSASRRPSLVREFSPADFLGGAQLFRAGSRACQQGGGGRRWARVPAERGLSAACAGSSVRGHPRDVHAKAERRPRRPPAVCRCCAVRRVRTACGCSFRAWFLKDFRSQQNSLAHSFYGRRPVAPRSRSAPSTGAGARRHWCGHKTSEPTSLHQNVPIWTRFGKTCQSLGTVRRPDLRRTSTAHGG